MLNFFKKNWVKRVASGITALYGLLLIWLTWASYAYVMEYDNVKALYAVYLIITLIFGALMVYSKKQLFTTVLVMLLLPINLVFILLNFGSWFYVLPSTVILIIMFFACHANETLKVVLGTIYLLMYVLGSLAFMAFTIIFGQLNLHGFNLNYRKEEVVSLKETYRYVRYVEPEDAKNRRIYFYAEPNTEDINFGLVKFKKVVGAQRIYAGKYAQDIKIRWLDDDSIMVDGMVEDVTLGNDWGDEGLNESSDVSSTPSRPSVTSEQSTQTQATPAP